MDHPKDAICNKQVSTYDTGQICHTQSNGPRHAAFQLAHLVSTANHLFVKPSLYSLSASVPNSGRRFFKETPATLTPLHTDTLVWAVFYNIRNDEFKDVRVLCVTVLKDLVLCTIDIRCLTWRP